MAPDIVHEFKCDCLLLVRVAAINSSKQQQQQQQYQQ
jgi:hypothetical protein